MIFIYCGVQIVVVVGGGVWVQCNSVVFVVGYCCCFIYFWCVFVFLVYILFIVVVEIVFGVEVVVVVWGGGVFEFDGVVCVIGNG